MYESMSYYDAIRRFALFYVRVGMIKRVLEYGVRPPVFYGNLREETVFHEILQEACFVLTEISGNLREFTG